MNTCLLRCIYACIFLLLITVTPERARTLWKLEALWWLLTLLVALLILLPIILWTKGYPFYADNTLFIVTFITFGRYIFLLPHTFLAQWQWVKLALIFVCIPFVFYLVQQLNGFQTFLDENGPEALVGAMPYEQVLSMTYYVRTQLLLFAVGSIVSVGLFPFRMIVSIWRKRNLGRE